MAPMQGGPQIGVVVVTRNRAARLASLLASLRAQTIPADRFEVVVVDDGSEDDTYETVGREASSAPFALRVDRRAHGLGLARLRNVGWRRSQAPHIAFVDDDCEADADWLRECLAAAARAPNAVIQGRTTPIDRELSRLGPLARTKQIESPGPWYQTCNIAYPRPLLERLGGFDASYAIAGEDTDLAWRAIEAGARVEYAPRATVRHAVERIGVRGWLRIAMRERSLARLFARHPSLRAEVARLGLFKGEQHAAIALAIAAVALARPLPPALALAGPYAAITARRMRAVRANPCWAPWFALYDLIALLSSVRGSIEYRAGIV
jgi:GT2 family glycosyltransferase